MLEVFIFLLAFSVSFIGILVPGMTSALGVSSMILLGLPIQIAKTTFQVGSAGASIGGAIWLMKTQKARMDLVIPLAIIALVSWYIWGHILISIPTNILIKLTGIFMILLLVINISSKSLWIIAEEITHKRKIAGFVAYFLMNIFYSVFPMWAGVLYQFLHVFFFRVTNLQARFMGTITTVPFVIGFIIPVIASGFYDLSSMIIYGIWGYIGGYLGAKSGVKLGNTWLKRILIWWLFSLGIYFIFLDSKMEYQWVIYFFDTLNNFIIWILQSYNLDKYFYL